MADHTLCRNDIDYWTSVVALLNLNALTGALICQFWFPSCLLEGSKIWCDHVTIGLWSRCDRNAIAPRLILDHKIGNVAHSFDEMTFFSVAFSRKPLRSEQPQLAIIDAHAHVTAAAFLSCLAVGFFRFVFYSFPRWWINSLFAHIFGRRIEAIRRREQQRQQSTNGTQRDFEFSNFSFGNRHGELE